jgi:hypothetical protein
VQGAIKFYSLPIHNLLNNTFFSNLELFFHSLIAQLVLLLQINPLNHYVLLKIFINSLFVVLVYVFLKLNKISKLVSAIGAMFLLYITSGANLPYIWHLIPFNFGLIFSVIAMCFMKMDKFLLSCLAVLFTLLFYPPLFLFSGTAFIVYLIPKSSKLDPKVFQKILKIYLPIAVLVLLLGLILAFIFTSATSSYLASRVWFETFVGDLLPRYYVYNVIVWPVLVLVFFGIYEVFKRNKIIFYQFLLGCLMWFAYSLTTRRFFIEFERVAVFTAVLCVIISTYGIEIIIQLANKFFKNKNLSLCFVTFGQILIILSLFVCIPFYTQNENWKKLVFLQPATGQKAYPKAPANNYLTQDDLQIFKNIKDKKFLSIPWKGTVVGVATGNYPALTKEGTFSVGNSVILANFVRGDCQAKQKLAKNNKLDYIYLYPFDCQGFEKISESQEGLILYEF